MTAPHFRTTPALLGSQPIPSPSRLRKLLYLLNGGFWIVGTLCIPLIIAVGSFQVATMTTPQENLDTRMSQEFSTARTLLDHCPPDASSCPAFQSYYTGTLAPDVIRYRSVMYDTSSTATDHLVIGSYRGSRALDLIFRKDALLIVANEAAPS